MESTKDLAYKLKYYMFGMDELEAMFSARDAEVAKQARAECAERAVEWLYPKNGIYNCCLSDGMEREKRKESLRLAITQGTQGQSDPSDALIDAMRRYMAAYGPGYSSTDTAPHARLVAAFARIESEEVGKP